MAETATASTESAPAKAKYGWWDQVPENLKTKTVLGKEGLKPTGKPCAYIEYGYGRRYRCYDLYDVSETKPKRKATEKQLAALEAARIKARSCQTCGADTGGTANLQYGECWDCVEKAKQERHQAFLDESADEAIVWARQIIADGNAVVLDTETTDLDGEICEVAVVDLAGETLFDSLVKPVGPMGATHIHGITAEEVADAPSFFAIWPSLSNVLRGKTILAYNASFDYGRIESEVHEALCGPNVQPPDFDVVCHEHQDAAAVCRKRRDAYYGYRTVAGKAAKDWLAANTRWECIMENYSAWYGDWSSYHHDFRWQALGGGHRAKGDALAALERLKGLAGCPRSTETLHEVAPELAPAGDSSVQPSQP